MATFMPGWSFTHKASRATVRTSDHSSRHPAWAVRILLVGAGGVGGAAAAIAGAPRLRGAARRGRLRPRPRAGRVDRSATRGSTAARVDASDEAAVATALAEHRGDARCSTRPTRGSSCRCSGRPGRRGHLPRHGDVDVGAAPGAPVRAVRGQARRRAVRPGRRRGRRRAARPGRASASSRGSRTSSPATPPTTCSPTIDEFGVRDGANLSSTGDASRPSFSIWTLIEECLNPPVVWERGPRLVHHRAVQRAGGVRLPRRASGRWSA